MDLEVKDGPPSFVCPVKDTVLQLRVDSRYLGEPPFAVGKVCYSV